MKVNIRYTVDLEEVLEEMSSLYYKSTDKLDENLDVYDSFLRIHLERHKLNTLFQP